MKSKDSNSKKSVSYQKKDGCGHTRPSFFWYDNDKDLKMMSAIHPGSLVFQWYAYVRKTVWMAIVHLPRFRIIHIPTVLEGFVYV